MLIASTVGICSCGKLDPLNHNHEYFTVSVNKESACYSQGEELLKCWCGKTKTNATYTLDHYFVNGVCEFCKNSTEQVENKMLYCNHYHTEMRFGYEPTCTEMGLTDLKKCIDCGFVIFDHTILPPRHNYSNNICVDCGAENIGPQVGQKCPSYTLDTVGGYGETVNISEFLGKTVVINFWESWYLPSTEELTSLNALAEEYADDVVFLAVHSTERQNEAEMYVNENFPYSRMIFAYDAPLTENEKTYYTLLGGTGYYPKTLILDENGLITFTYDGTVNYDMLREQINSTLGYDNGWS